MFKFVIIVPHEFIQVCIKDPLATIVGYIATACTNNNNYFKFCRCHQAIWQENDQVP